MKWSCFCVGPSVSHSGPCGWWHSVKLFKFRRTPRPGCEGQAIGRMSGAALLFLRDKEAMAGMQAGSKENWKQGFEHIKLLSLSASISFPPLSMAPLHSQRGQFLWFGEIRQQELTSVTGQNSREWRTTCWLPQLKWRETHKKFQLDSFRPGAPP